MNFNILNEEERRLIEQGQFINAIKSLRARLNCSLLDAKRAADSYRQRIGTMPDRECIIPHDFIKVRNSRADAIVCRVCGVLYHRA